MLPAEPSDAGKRSFGHRGTVAYGRRRIGAEERGIGLESVGLLECGDSSPLSRGTAQAAPQHCHPEEKSGDESPPLQRVEGRHPLSEAQELPLPPRGYPATIRPLVASAYCADTLLSRERKERCHVTVGSNAVVVGVHRAFWSAAAPTMRWCSKAGSAKSSNNRPRCRVRISSFRESRERAGPRQRG